MNAVLKNLTGVLEVFGKIHSLSDPTNTLANALPNTLPNTMYNTYQLLTGVPPNTLANTLANTLPNAI